MAWLTSMSLEETLRHFKWGSGDCVGVGLGHADGDGLSTDDANSMGNGWWGPIYDARSRGNDGHGLAPEDIEQTNSKHSGDGP